MDPTLRHGDHLLVAPVPSEKLAMPGQVVVARHPWKRECVVVKRLQGLGAGGMWLRGDNPAGTDSRQFGPVPLVNLIGVVTAYFGSGTGRVPQAPAVTSLSSDTQFEDELVP